MVLRNGNLQTKINITGFQTISRISNNSYHFMNYKFCKLQQTITNKIVCRSMTLVINIRKYSLNYDAFEMSRS